MLDDDDEPASGEAGLPLLAQRAAYRHVLYHANECVHEVMVAKPSLLRPTEIETAPRS